MERPRMRPLFKRELPSGGERLMAVIGERLAAPDARFEGALLRSHAHLTVRPQERHFWSPHLSLDLLRDGQSTTLRGRYAPHPSIWTGIMSLYGLLGMVGLAGSVFGYSQWLLGWTPWALLSIPVALVGTAATWIAAAIGLRLADAQMHALHDFLQECLRSAGESVPGPDSGAAAQSV